MTTTLKKGAEMSKQQLKDEMLRMIGDMEANTFLLPDSFTDEIQMASRDAVYKTYVGGRGANRYIQIYYSSDDFKVNIIFTRDKITTGEVDILARKPSIEKVFDVVQAIYKEKHSFDDRANGVAKIRAKIRDTKKKVAEGKELIKKLEQQIVDSQTAPTTKPKKDR